MSTIRWGVLSTANIGVKKVIPAMQKACYTQMLAIASQTLPKAQETAKQLGIERAYGSYEELLNDPDIDAIYNPLPNHLHVEWTIKAMRAGKHVLVEKPLTNNSRDIHRLLEVQNETGRLVSEAYMIKASPQWRRVLEIIKSGELGEINAVQGCFYFRNLDSDNIRNRAETLGGALMDIGCYPLTVARMVFGKEPEKVIALMDTDPEFQTDRLTSAILQFGHGQCTFTVGTQTTSFQRVFILGTLKHLEIRIPFNTPNNQETQIWTHAGNVLKDNESVIHLPVNDQYTLQAEAFAKAVLQGHEPLSPLTDSFASAACIEALIVSNRTGKWEVPQRL